MMRFLISNMPSSDQNNTIKGLNEGIVQPVTVSNIEVQDRSGNTITTIRDSVFESVKKNCENTSKCKCPDCEFKLKNRPAFLEGAEKMFSDAKEKSIFDEKMQVVRRKLVEQIIWRTEAAQFEEHCRDKYYSNKLKLSKREAQKIAKEKGERLMLRDKLTVVRGERTAKIANRLMKDKYIDRNTVVAVLGEFTTSDFDLSDLISNKENALDKLMLMLQAQEPVVNFLHYVTQSHLQDEPIENIDKAADNALEELFNAYKRNFNKLQKNTNKTEPIKIYLKKALYDSLDMARLDVVNIWREKMASFPIGSKEHECMVKNLEEAAGKANLYADTFLGTDSLSEEVRKTNNIEKLLQIIRTVVPTTKKNYRLLLSTVTKINFMHLAEVIRTQLNPDHMEAISDHLKRRLDNCIVFINGKKYLRCSDDGVLANMVEIEDIQVASSKDEISIARKFLTKDLQYTKDFDLSKISDLIRFRVVLPKFSSKPENLERATIKVMSILLSIFGTDYSQERLKESFTNGSTNINSTGNHRAFHCTFRYRNQCESNTRQASNGNNGSTESCSLNIIPVELQVVPFMYGEEAEKDHDNYKEGKDKKIRKYVGLEVPFDQFLEDLCHTIIHYDSFPEEAKPQTRLYDRPLKEKLAMILFNSFTKREQENGEDSHSVSVYKKGGSKVAPKLVNDYFIHRLLQNEDAVTQLRHIFDMYLNAEPGINVGLRKEYEEYSIMQEDDLRERAIYLLDVRKRKEKKLLDLKIENFDQDQAKSYLLEVASDLYYNILKPNEPINKIDIDQYNKVSENVSIGQVKEVIKAMAHTKIDKSYEQREKYLQKLDKEAIIEEIYKLFGGQREKFYRLTVKKTDDTEKNKKLKKGVDMTMEKEKELIPGIQLEARKAYAIFERYLAEVNSL